ncbi:MAG TPA: OmpA family protein, partial [Campylobacterales bacterium]|nr:OmpA family protein [Campylobacterales bacterium]
SELNLLIDHIVTQLKTKSNKKVVLKSYTDDAGSRSYNIDMSVRRANMIKEKIVEKGIDGSRVIVKGEGGVNFISSNDTSDGRSQNNRVEVNLIDASN